MEMSAHDAASRQSESPVPGGEFPFTWSEFRKIAALVHSQAGIVLSEGKVNLVYSRLAKRLRAIGLKSFRDYCRLIEAEDGVDERQAMIAAMTTNVTRFFRESHHFDHLRDVVIPRLSQKLDAGGRVRIWSAGCSSGEEPYSIALTILNELPGVSERDLKILATDIDPNMVAKGRFGIYSTKLVGSIPDSLRRRFVEPAREEGSDACRISDEVRSLVSFRELNLLGSWPMRGKFDVIFCRNVMIYFDEQTQNAIWKRYAECMTSDATLFVGHSERISLDCQPFELIAQTTYRLSKGGTK